MTGKQRQLRKRELRKQEPEPVDALEAIEALEDRVLSQGRFFQSSLRPTPASCGQRTLPKPTLDQLDR